jgi:cytochrome c-type biogenesis protein
MSSGAAPLSHALAAELVTASSGGAGALVEHSPLGFVIAFGAGIASFVSPCVLPLVPSYLSMMSGVGGVGASAAAGPDAAERARLLWSTLLFVAGFSLVFAVLEATASTLSHPLQAHRLVLSDVAGALIVAMGVVIAFQLPWLQREHRFAVKPSRLGPWAAPVMGMTFASSGGTLARGEEMLVAYSFGLGVPFVLTGLAFGRLSGALGFARRHSRAVSLASGALLAALGVLIITGEVGVVSSWSNSLLEHIGLGGLASG